MLPPALYPTMEEKSHKIKNILNGKKKKKKRAELSVTVTDCRCINLLGTRGSAIPRTCEGPWVDCLAIEMKPRLIFIPTAKASSHQYPP